MKTRIFKIVALAMLVAALVCAMSITAFAAGNKTAKLSVSTVSAMPDETVTVTVSVDQNPGLASLKFDVAYDQYLTLEKVEFNTASFGAYVTTPPTIKNPQTITMISPLSDVTAEGVLATLTFKVAADAPDFYEAAVSVTFRSTDIYDSNFEPVDLEATNGGVSIRHGIPGDINGDFAVDTRDAILLFRYVAGWDVAVDPIATDVNGDFAIDTRDAILLFRYVAGWDVEIVRGQTQVSAHTHTMTENAAKAATCTEDGNTAYWYCTSCNKYYSDATAKNEITLADTVISATGHTYDNNVCTSCGDLKGSEGLKFTLNSDGESYSVIGIGTCTDTDIVIPSTYNGLPVTSIGDYAFNDCDRITSVII